ncbi:recombinase family protein [Flavonifractor hominis]|uniref:Recombinase family protein n=1 Tax=Flavonifractor hominis TaxID=3133178 RepID=A0ABV1EMK8_9FIRM
MAPRVGLYLRLSREDEGEGELSMSIANQEAFLRRYAEERDWPVARVYADDGYSGTHFERPAFRQMLEDIEAGYINLVMTKDLSRLGRDQSGTIYYYQCYFPLHGVRYIAVAEGFDTAANTSGIALPFLAAANDFYTADISRKVRAALDVRRRGGWFIGASPPLGYAKDPKEKGRLCPDPGTAWIARAVFETYLGCQSVLGTAKRLTERGVPTPAQCRGSGEGRFPGVWSDTTVRRILTNPTYAGDLTQGWSEKISYKLRQRRARPREQWVTVCQTHEPLIPPTQFRQVQQLLAVRGYRAGEGTGHLLTGLAFCADCGSPMTYVRESPTRTYMVCQGYRRSGRLGLCTAHRVREDAVLEGIRVRLAELGAGLNGTELAAATAAAKHSGGGQQRRALEREVERCRRAADSLYQDRLSGVLEEEEFAELFQANRDKRRAAQARLAALEQQKADEADWEKRVEHLLRFEELTRPVLLALVERVEVHADKRVKLYFRFAEPVKTVETRKAGGA